MQSNLLIFFKLFIFILFFITNSLADKIDKIHIIGNERVSDETVIIFSKLNEGDQISNNNLNNALKELYATDYFENIKISSQNGSVFIKVIENPIIQSIQIKGVKKKSINENLTKITSKVEKYPFVESKINDQIILLKNILKSYGYYFVKVETSINKNDNNTIGIVYDFNLGDIAKIKKINFIGDKVFRDNTLRNVILSEEDKFCKFLTNNKFLNNSRINLDVIRLEKFYKNRGFFDAKIKSTTAVINDKSQFEVIFNINSGKKFLFNNTTFKDNGNLPLKTIENFEKKFDNLKGKKYSKKKNR